MTRCISHSDQFLFPLVLQPPGATIVLEPMDHKRHGRKKPYTDAGIKRLPCFRCGQPATQQWCICADGNIHRPICTQCDILLNKLVLWFMRDPDWKAKLEKYEEVMK